MALIEQKTAVSAISDLLMCQLKGKRLPTWNEVYHAIYDLPTAQPERDDCDTCKHGYFGSAECNNCRVRYPSHWERREEET